MILANIAPKINQTVRTHVYMSSRGASMNLFKVRRRRPKNMWDLCEIRLVALITVQGTPVPFKGCYNELICFLKLP